MAVDPKIVDAIEQAVQEAGQSTALACRLIAWFDAIASGNEDINDRQSSYRHLELLYEEALTEGEPNESEAEDDLGDLEEPS